MADATGAGHDHCDFDSTDVSVGERLPNDSGIVDSTLGIIGASLGLLVTGKPMGFVVQLGLLALAGIIMRNSVILIDQIKQHINAGENQWEAIIGAAVTRFVPLC